MDASSPPLLPRRGLGSCVWADDQVFACSVHTPMHIVNSLAQRKTQIIPLELLAAAGTLLTYREFVRSKSVETMVHVRREPTANLSGSAAPIR